MATKTKNIISWILSCILAFVFFDAGLAKVLGIEIQLKNIESWHLLLWTRYPIGISERIKVIGLLIRLFRKKTLYDVYIWTAIAVITHLSVGQSNMLAPYVIFSIIASCILWLSKENNVTDNNLSLL